MIQIEKKRFILTELNANIIISMRLGIQRVTYGML